MGNDESIPNIQQIVRKKSKASQKNTEKSNCNILQKKKINRHCITSEKSYTNVHINFFSDKERKNLIFINLDRQQTDTTTKIHNKMVIQ